MYMPRKICRKSTETQGKSTKNKQNPQSPAFGRAWGAPGTLQSVDFELFVDFPYVSVDSLQIFLGIYICVTGVVTFGVPVVGYAQ